MGRYRTFVVRIWVDTSEDSPRGHIQQVATGRTAYFRDTNKMVRFINEQLGPLALPSGNPSAIPTHNIRAAAGGETDDR